MASTYDKPFLDVDGQLDRLSERGMVLNDRDLAYRELQAIGYYRLSGYWYPFRERSTDGGPRPSRFVEGTTFDEVLAIFRFDERLRLEVLHALSRIEVAMRFRIGHLLGRRGPFAHNSPAELSDTWCRPRTQRHPGPNCSESCSWTASDHAEWMRKQARNETISSEAFIAHFNSSYGTPLPIWTATEVMSFGDLNRLFAGMTQRDRQQIATELDVYEEDGNGDARVLANWLEHLRQTRNFCAHHARLWNRNHTVPLAVPQTIAEMLHLRGTEDGVLGTRSVSRPASRIYGTMVLVTFLLARIDHSNAVREAMRGLVEQFAEEQPGRLREMGFPEGWAELHVWRPDYARDARLAGHAELLRDVDLLYRADAAQRLSHKSTPKERAARLNYYRKHGAVLSAPGAQAHRYPAFQFDDTIGDVPELVVLANRRLLNGGECSEDERWAALAWWVSEHAAIPGGLSPRRALADEKLTRQILDRLLPPRADEDE